MRLHCSWYPLYQVSIFGAGCVQLRIRSAEPPGEHRYENWNNNNRMRLHWLAEYVSLVDLL